MIKVKNLLKWNLIGILLAGAIFSGCEKNDDNPDYQGNVVLSSPTVGSGGSLSVNATARFDAQYTDSLGETPELVYEWSLQQARGTLVINNQDNGAQAQISTPSVNVRGNEAGDETITVKVLDAQTGNVLAADELSFKITEPSGTSHCFDDPMLFFRNNNWDAPAITAIGLESDTRKSTILSAQNWLTDISKDGNWLLREDFSDDKTTVFWLDACDGSGSKKITESTHLIETPVFGPNDKYIYFTESVSYPEQTQDPRAVEIARVDIETGEKVYISNFRVFAKYPKVSPDGKWIAFLHGKETFDAGGRYAGSIDQFAIMPAEGGPAKFLATISGGRVSSPSWSPDSKDIIFYFSEDTYNNGPLKEGIYRLYIDGGGAPELLYSHKKTSSPRNVAYYANGTRIAFDGTTTASTDTQFDIWSIDANGNDLKRLADEKYNVFLQFIWEP